MAEQKKKSKSIRIKLIGIVIPIVLVIIISFFSLASNVVLKKAQDELQAKSQVYTEEISSWTNQIFAELQVYQDAIEEGNFADDAAILRYMETTVEKMRHIQVVFTWEMTQEYIWMVPAGFRDLTGF